jgi:hypothetical protein
MYKKPTCVKATNQHDSEDVVYASGFILIAVIAIVLNLVVV